MAKRKIKGERIPGYVRRQMRGGVPEGATLEMLEAELARREAAESLLAFTLATNPTYEAEWFHEEVAAALDQFLRDVIARKGPRLMIAAPPQHGKSELVSRRFPAYALGRNPALRIICTSYAAELAETFCVAVQRVMESPVYRAVFPETTIPGEYARDAKEKRRADVFEVIGTGGGVRAAGVGGGITGQSADILIVDDPIKDFTQAHSDAYRATLRNWYGSTAYTRLSSGGGVLVMQTRWHERDLAGQLLTEQAAGAGDPWQLINFPAIAEQDEPRRKTGEALAPKRFTLFDLELKKRALGSYQFNALYQQRPAPPEGGIWKRGWWRTWGNETTSRKLPESFDRVFQSWDCTFKDTKDADFVCGGVWGTLGADAFLLDAVHARMDFVATVAAVKRMAAKWPSTVARLVEDKANGPAVISALKREIGGLIEVDPQGGKEARANAVSPMIEAGNVYLPEAAVARWSLDLIEESAGFPNAAHDDWVDMISQALTWWRGRRGFGLLDYAKEEKARALAKPDVGRNAEACAGCGSTIVQAIGAARRCANCGNQWGQDAVAAPALGGRRLLKHG